MKNFDCDIFMASLRKMLNEPIPKAPNLPTLIKLTNLAGEDFLRQAYRLILKREVDPAGIRVYAAASNSRPGRAKILCMLLLSPERGKAPIWLIQNMRKISRLLKILGLRRR